MEARIAGSPIYFHFPFLLVGTFPSVSAEQFQRLCVFCRIYAESLVWQDKLIDETPTGEATATTTLRIALMQAEAYRLLHQMSLASVRFWDRFHGYLIEHTRACLLERQFVTGERPFKECTDEVRREIVLGKTALARSIVAALVELSGDEHLYDPLIELVDKFNFAAQVWDDLEDWKDDVKHGVPTVVVSRLVDTPPVYVDDAQWKGVITRLSQKFYYHRHAQAVLSLFIDSLHAVERHTEVCPGLGLYEKAKFLRRRGEKLLKDIERIVADNLARASARQERQTTGQV